MATPRPCTEARFYGFQRGETESLVSDMPAFCLLPLPPALIAGEQRTREGRALSPAAVSVCLALETQSLFSPPSRSGVACKARTDQDWLDSFGFSDVLFCVVAAPTQLNFGQYRRVLTILSTAGRRVLLAYCLLQSSWPWSKIILLRLIRLTRRRLQYHSTWSKVSTRGSSRWITPSLLLAYSLGCATLVYLDSRQRGCLFRLRLTVHGHRDLPPRR